MLRRDERAHLRRPLTRIANYHLRRGSAELGEELVGDFRFGQDARSREAYLACVEILTGSSFRGGIEVGVGAHDEGRLATELERNRRQRARRRCANQLCSVGRTSEAESIDIRMT